MEIDEAISILRHAALFNPVALIACCAAEMTRLKTPEDRKVALNVISVLAAFAAEAQ